MIYANINTASGSMWLSKNYIEEGLYDNTIRYNNVSELIKMISTSILRYNVNSNTVINDPEGILSKKFIEAFYAYDNAVREQLEAI